MKDREKRLIGVRTVHSGNPPQRLLFVRFCFVFLLQAARMLWSLDIVIQ